MGAVSLKWSVFRQREPDFVQAVLDDLRKETHESDKVVLKRIERYFWNVHQQKKPKPSTVRCVVFGFDALFSFMIVCSLFRLTC
jgi:hypothetical protein